MWYISIYLSFVFNFLAHYIHFISHTPHTVSILISVSSSKWDWKTKPTKIITEFNQFFTCSTDNPHSLSSRFLWSSLSLSLSLNMWVWRTWFLQEKFCNNACVERYLEGNGDSVKKAAKHLRNSLSWRDSFGVGNLIIT